MYSEIHLLIFLQKHRTSRQTNIFTALISVNKIRIKGYNYFVLQDIAATLTIMHTKRAIIEF